MNKKTPHNFNYLIDKILGADFSSDPFKHVYIDEFFSEEHFFEIVGCDEIRVPAARNDHELIEALKGKGFKPIEFPGCVTDADEYVQWRAAGKAGAHHTACEGFGMTLRLYDFQSPILTDLNAFLSSELFNRAIANKFGIDFDDCVFDGGIQKYLDGYEISPHPDIRKKATTFMVNINPSNDSEKMDHHTHYMALDQHHNYVESFWRGNTQCDRAWVPWSWARTVKQQTKNNSIVLFSPTNNTLHGVKANYNHFLSQRTQLYGNLWYKDNPVLQKVEWEQLDILSGVEAPVPNDSINISQSFTRKLPRILRAALGRLISDKSEIGDRHF